MPALGWQVWEDCYNECAHCRAWLPAWQCRGLLEEVASRRASWVHAGKGTGRLKASGRGDIRCLGEQEHLWARPS